jgi:hypothetical protein
LFGLEACADVVGAALLLVADYSVDVCCEVDGSALVADPHPDRPIPIAIAAMAITPARSERVIGSPVGKKSRA